MWIKRITLENFQSHPFTSIELSPNINVFLGRGNRGKTAIIRAILWVFFNEPQGDAFIRKGKSIARVTITLSDGTTVIRERGKNTNKYILITKDGDRKEYSSFGRGVPEDIKKALKIRVLPIEHGRRLSPQIKEQMDSLYLLDETPSTIHTTLLTISGGHVIDEAVKSLATDIIKIQRKEKEVSEEIENLKNLLEEFKGIDEKRDKLLRLKDEVENLKNLYTKKEKLIKLRQSLRSIDTKLTFLKNQFKILSEIDSIGKVMEEVQEHKVRLYDLKKIKEKYIDNEKKIDKFEKLHRVLDKDVIKEETVDKINALKERYISLINKRLKLKSIMDKEKKVEKEKEQIEVNIDKLIGRYVSVIGREGVCPVCLREVDDKLIHEVEKNIKRMWR